MIQIKHRITGAVLFECEAESIKACVRAAISAEADLSKADLSWADLSKANLSWANLSEANLSKADLSKADLSWANLSWADLSKANLSKANLSKANLSWANLSEANLSWADLDFSSGFTFACKTFHIKAELRLAAQLAYHFCRFDFGDCEEAKQAQTALKSLANKFHRAGECGLIE